MAVESWITFEILQDNEALRHNLRIHGIQCPVFNAIFDRFELKDLPLFGKNIASLRSFDVAGGGKVNIHWGLEENDPWQGFAEFSFPRFESSFRPLGEIFQILKLILEALQLTTDEFLSNIQKESWGKMIELDGVLAKVYECISLFQDHGSVEKIIETEWELRRSNALLFTGVKYTFVEPWLPTVDPQLFELELSTFSIELLRSGYIFTGKNPRSMIINYFKMGRLWGTVLPDTESSILNSSFPSLKQVALAYNFLVSLAQSRGSLPATLNNLPFGIDWTLKIRWGLPTHLDLWTLSQKLCDIWIDSPSVAPGRRLEVIDNYEFELYVDYIDDNRLGYVGIASWEECENLSD